MFFDCLMVVIYERIFICYFYVNFIWMSIHMNGCSYVLVYKVNYRTHLYKTIISNHYYFIIIHKTTRWFTKKQHIIKHDRKCYNTVLLRYFLLYKGVCLHPDNARKKAKRVYQFYIDTTLKNRIFETNSKKILRQSFR